MTTFEELGVPLRAVQALRNQGITTPNPVQLETIPSLLRRSDVVIQAPTGSGKTLAFLLPMVERLQGHQSDGPRGLIVAPTRELASQIGEVLRKLDPRLRITLVYGGVPYSGQLRSLRQSPDVVIGCPGRINDLAGQRATRFGSVEYLVLDEADEMLDQGFAKDVERIIALTPSTRQTVLASATMPAWVQTMVAKHLTAPVTVHVETDVEPDLEHGLLAVPKSGKIDTLHTLLNAERGRTLVFHRTKHGAKKLARDLNNRGHATAELQGNLSQNARDRAIASFRTGRTPVLVATNVAARGIDVSDVGLVVNFELPDTAEWLTHRIGRTARNGAKGRALTFLSEEDGAQWQKLQRLGAPNLQHVDPNVLISSGEWIYLAPEPRRTHVPSRTNGRGNGRPRPQGQGAPRYQGGSDSRDQHTSRPREYDSPRPQGQGSPRPQGQGAPRPQGYDSQRSRGYDSPRANGNDSASQQGQGAPRSRGYDSSRPQGEGSSRTQGYESRRPQGHDAPRRQGNDSGPRSQGRDDSRSSSQGAPRAPYRGFNRSRPQSRRREELAAG